MAMIPDFYSGFNDAQRRNDQTAMAGLQQAGALQQLAAQMQAQQQSAAVRDVLAKSGGDLNKAIPALTQLGPAGVQVAGSLAQLAERQAKSAAAQRETAFFSPENQAKYMIPGRPEQAAVTDVSQTNQGLDSFDPKPAQPAVAPSMDVGAFRRDAAMLSPKGMEAYATHLDQSQARKDALEARLYDIKIRSQDRNASLASQEFLKAQELATRRELAALIQSNRQSPADRTPSGYERDPADPTRLRPISGGPADPNNLKGQAKAADKNNLVNGLSDDIDTLVTMLENNPDVAGGRGLLVRGMESAQGFLDPSAANTDGHLFDSRLRDLKNRMQLLRNDKRFSKLSQQNMDNIIQGTGLGQNAATSIATLRDMQMKMQRDLGAGDNAPAAPAAPADGGLVYKGYKFPNQKAIDAFKAAGG